jgi:hypothetical protein
MTLLLLAAISVLYRLRNRFGGGAAEPNGAAKVSAWVWTFCGGGMRVMLSQRVIAAREGDNGLGRPMFLNAVAKGRGANNSP